MKNITAQILAILGGSLLTIASSAGTAGAATVFVDNGSGWTSAVSGTITTETFSTNMADAQVLAINADLTSTTNNWTGSSIHRVQSGGMTLGWGDALATGGGLARYDVFTWTFSNPITALQAYFDDFEAGFQVSFDEGGTSPTVLDVNTLLGDGTGLLGLVFNQAITTLTFSTTWNYDLSSIDDLSYATASAAVPVPAALPLLATAFGGLGFLGWRRRRSASA